MALRTLLRENDMSAWVNLSLEREPSFFAVKSPAAEEFAVIARNNNTLVGMYTYTLQQVYCNGEASCLGYLGWTPRKSIVSKSASRTKRWIRDN